MNLAEQLTELRVNILRDFSTQVSGSSDQLWSDDTLTGYIKDAESRWFRSTMMLRDADTPAYTQVTLATGVSRYMLDPLVLSVISARFNTDSFDLARIGRCLVTDVAPPDGPYFDPGYYSSTNPGRPQSFWTDELLVYQSKQRTSLTLSTPPSAQENGLKLYLRVARNTLRTYVLGGVDLQAESEVPDDYGLDVLEWAAYRALRNHDADAGDSTDAATHKTAFEDAIEKCKDDLRSRLVSNTSFVFGGNGFAWTR